MLLLLRLFIIMMILWKRTNIETHKMKKWDSSCRIIFSGALSLLWPNGIKIRMSGIFSSEETFFPTLMMIMHDSENLRF